MLVSYSLKISKTQKQYYFCTRIVFVPKVYPNETFLRCHLLLFFHPENSFTKEFIFFSFMLCGQFC